MINEYHTCNNLKGNNNFRNVVKTFRFKKYKSGRKKEKCICSFYNMKKHFNNFQNV